MTNQESNQQQYPQNYPPYEDEINLIDYLRVLWKWKWLIIAGTLICAIIAAMISLQMPKIYRVAMVIEPGIIGLDKSRNYIYMNSQNISGKINEGSYNKSIKKLLNTDSSKTNFEFKADVSKFTNQIRINAECKEKDINLGLKASKLLIALISDDGEKVVEQRKNDYDMQIVAKQNEISKVETQERKDIDEQILLKQNEIKKTEIQWRRDTDKQVRLKLNSINKKRDQIKLQEGILETTRQRLKELELEAKKVKDNTEKIIKQRDILLKDSRTRDDISLLLYATTIQQNVSYSIQLGNQIYSLRTNVQAKEANIEELNRDIDLVTTEIENLKLYGTETLQAKMDGIRTEIEKLKLQRAEGLPAEINIYIKEQIKLLTSAKENISNIKVLQNPEVSSAPVKSKKKQIVLLSVVVGLFFMIFLAFFIEYIKNATRSTKQTTE